MQNVLVSEEYTNHLLDRLQSMREKGVLLDDTFKVRKAAGDELAEYKAHRVLLAAHSEYFKSRYRMQESTTAAPEAEIPGITDGGFAPIFDYFYTCRLPIQAAQLSSILQASDYLIVSSIKQAVVQYLLHFEISPDLAIPICEWALATQHSSLLTALRPGISRLPLTLAHVRESVLRATFDFFQMLVADESTTAAECDLLELTIAFILRNQRELTADQCAALLSHVRHSQVAEADLRDILAQHPGALDNPAVRSFHDKLLSGALEARLQPRNGNYQLLLLLPRGEPGLYLYDLHTGACGPLTHAQDPTVAQMTACFRQLPLEQPEFFSVDLRGGELSALIFNRNTQYPQLPQMMVYQNREWFLNYYTAAGIESFAHAGRRLLHVGGFQEGPKKGSALYGDRPWRLLGCMSTPRVAHAVLHLYGSVYALGGHVGEAALASCEALQLDPEPQQWELLPPMAQARQGHLAVGVDRAIYVLGGYASAKDEQPVPTNERFCTQERRWSEFAAPCRSCDYLAAAVFGSCIVALVRNLDKQPATTETHMYDVGKQEWRLLHHLDGFEATKRFRQALAITKQDILDL